ncbi:alpha/beta hydrolase family protein [Colwellia piezophila]|uniref:alpha/beta hydrolase family protein n=1 Tax=Colwellia piezophila TaxID=211668 RepID=UPI000370E35C|nr:alpha/beta fold hydrolase [Colwellia piezophila]
MNKLLSVILVTFLSGTIHASNGDAPGGKEVLIKSNDLNVFGVLYDESTNEVKKRPALIFLHGWAPQNVRAGERGTYTAKKFSKSGYVTLAVTMRGWPDTGGDDLCGWKQPQDISLVVDWLKKQANVDPNRIGIVGHSQGGQVALLTSALNKSIKSVVAYYPVTDISLWSKKTDLPKEAVDSYINGVCAYKASQEDRSPVFKAERINANVLLMHGEDDQRVPIEHSEIMLTALLKFNKKAQLHRIKKGHHGAYGQAWEGSELFILNYLNQHL